MKNTIAKYVFSLCLIGGFGSCAHGMRKEYLIGEQMRIRPEYHLLSKGWSEEYKKLDENEHKAILEGLGGLSLFIIGMSGLAYLDAKKK